MPVSLKSVYRCMLAEQHIKELFSDTEISFTYVKANPFRRDFRIREVVGNELVFSSTYGGDISSSTDGIFLAENVDTMAITLECSFSMSYKINSVLHLERMFETATNSHTGCSDGNCVSSSSDDNQDLNTRLNSAEITYDTNQVPEVGKKFWYTISAPLKMPIRKCNMYISKNKM